MLLSPHCGKTITFPSSPEVFLHQLLHHRHEADRFGIPNENECGSRRAMERIKRTQKAALSLFPFTNLNSALHSRSASCFWGCVGDRLRPSLNIVPVVRERRIFSGRQLFRGMESLTKDDAANSLELSADDAATRQEA